MTPTSLCKCARYQLAQRTQSPKVMSSAQAATSRSCDPTSKRRPQVLLPCAVRGTVSHSILDTDPHDHAFTESAFPLLPRGIVPQTPFPLPMLGDAQHPVEVYCCIVQAESKDFLKNPSREGGQVRFYRICFRIMVKQVRFLRQGISSRTLIVDRSRG